MRHNDSQYKQKNQQQALLVSPFPIEGQESSYRNWAVVDGCFHESTKVIGRSSSSQGRETDLPYALVGWWWQRWEENCYDNAGPRLRHIAPPALSRPNSEVPDPVRSEGGSKRNKEQRRDTSTLQSKVTQKELEQEATWEVTDRTANCVRLSSSSSSSPICFLLRLLLPTAVLVLSHSPFWSSGDHHVLFGHQHTKA